jgi:hypothetical protein
MRNRHSPVLLALVAMAGCVGVIGDPEGESIKPTSSAPAFAPAEATLHRLTRPQIQNAWIDLLGKELILPEDLPADDVLYGFSSISAARSTISPVDAEKYESATYNVLDQVFADPARRSALIGCDPASVTDPCVKDFITSFAERAWRRPVTEAETASLLSLSGEIGADLGDTGQGVKFMLAAVLLSPHFLFRVEIGEPADGQYRYTSWEMASRLSFLLHDAPPDDALRAAAKKNELTTAKGVRAEAARLLGDQRARVALTRFFRDFMNLSKLDALDKQPDKFPQLSATLGPSMRLEIERMFEENVFEREADFRDLFTTRETYVNEDLARVYGIEGISGPDWVPIELPDDGKRAGILTTPGFLALNAHKTQTSPTHRGRFVRLNLLCQDIPPPPPGINTTLPEADPEKPTTLRERLDKHAKDPNCAGCHNQMDPIGFALERYDAIGVYRDVDENNLPIDSTSSVEGHAVDGPLDLAALVAELPEVGACVARRFYEHGGAHLAGRGDESSVDKLVEIFVSSDYTFKELVLALVTNDGYRYASPPAAEKEVEP